MRWNKMKIIEPYYKILTDISNGGAEMIDEQSYRRMHDRGLC
jgi:hypothetical protein